MTHMHFLIRALGSVHGFLILCCWSASRSWEEWLERFCKLPWSPTSTLASSLHRQDAGTLPTTWATRSCGAGRSSSRAKPYALLHCDALLCPMYTAIGCCAQGAGCLLLAACMRCAQVHAGVRAVLHRHRHPWPRLPVSIGPGLHLLRHRCHRSAMASTLPSKD